jgi:hypothetical protein
MNKTGRLAGGAALVACMLAMPAAAQSILGMELDLEGSLGEGRFETGDYVPPVTQFVLNETPFITTEVKPIFAYHEIPDGFVTGGGRVLAGAVQGRIALTERLAIIATTDGYADVDFDSVLPDTDGFLDVAAGVKYAVISDPDAGNIVSLGLRYTAPVGNVDTAGIDLTGAGNGYLNAFVSGAKVYGWGLQVQGSAGAQLALSDENWSYLHAHGHANLEVLPGVFPLVEANMILPVDGGDRVPGASLTGADIFDIGASDPQPILSLGIGTRLRAADNVILGAAVEGNVLDIGADTADSVYGWRVTTDLTIHF